MTYIETQLTIEYIDEIGDDFDDDISEKDRMDLMENHIQDYCDEHKIPRESVKVKQ